MNQRLTCLTAMLAFALAACGDEFGRGADESSSGPPLPTGVGGGGAGAGGAGTGAGGGTCGNGLKDGNEACDEGDLGGATCSSAGEFVAGTLACTSACKLDSSACEPPPPAPQPRLPMNNDYVGSVHAHGSLRPRFAWSEVLVDAPEQPVTYLVTLANDASMSDVVAEESVSESEWQPEQDLPVSQSVPVGARYYWNVRACVGAICTAPSATWSVRVGRQMQDVNGDGYADMFTGGVGFAYHDGFLFFGSPSGFGAPVRMPDVTGKFIGDLDDDGYGELATQRLESDRIRIWRGAGGTAIATGTPVLFATDHGTGYSGVGDVNGDFYDDFAIGEDFANDEAGRVLVYLGGPGALDATEDTVLDGLAGDHLGVSVDGIDIDGDGLSDIIAGAPSGDEAIAGPGRIHVAYGAASFPGAIDTTLVGPANGSRFGAQVAAVGDVDGDGRGDVAVLASEAASGSTSEVSLYRGEADGFGAPVKFSGSNADGFASCMVGAGDLDADGYDDLLVCEPGAEGGDGRLHLAKGAAMASAMSLAVIITGVVPDGRFASGASFVDDFNGDGKDDLVVGSHSIDSGTVRLYHGGTGNLFSDDSAPGVDTSDYVGEWVD